MLTFGGPYPHSTYNGSKFFLAIVDGHSRATWVHRLAHKSNAFPLLKSICSLCEKIVFCFCQSYKN